MPYVYKPRLRPTDKEPRKSEYGKEAQVIQSKILSSFR